MGAAVLAHSVEAMGTEGKSEKYETNLLISCRMNVLDVFESANFVVFGLKRVVATDTL